MEKNPSACCFEDDQGNNIYNQVNSRNHGRDALHYTEKLYYYLTGTQKIYKNVEMKPRRHQVFTLEYLECPCPPQGFDDLIV